MRILYLITKSEIGGAQTHVAQLANYFVKNNHEVSVMCLPGGWLEEEVKKNGATFVPNIYFSNNFNPVRFIFAVRTIREFVKKFKPDIVACHSTAAGFIGRVAIRNKIPTVYTAHGWSFETGTPLWRRLPAILLEKYAAHFCSKIICVSKYTRDIGIKFLIANQDKMTVVYNGVENTVLNKKDKNSKLKIIFVGRLSKQKSPELLIEAVSGLPNNLLSKIEVLIVGTGSKIGIVNELINKNKNLLIKILSSATRTDVFRMLDSSDIFVLSTNWEGFPYSILEAMSVGLPVIATDVGGINEIVNTSCGFLVKRGDVVSLQEALSVLIKEDDVRKKMGENAKKIIINKFSINKMLFETEKVYTAVINNKPL